MRAIVLLLILLADCAFASRGLNIQYRANEASDAPVVGEMALYSNSYALVIGNDLYSGQGWPRLSNAVEDARKIAETLESKGFEVTLKTDLLAQDMKAVFEDFFIDKGQDPNARLFVWYAGHGHTVNGEGYLIPVDGVLETDKRAFLRRSLSLREFGRFVRLAESKHIYAVFDSCFAGTIFNVARSAPPPAITRITSKPVRQFMSSGDAGQTVSDDGTFAQLFVEALNGERRADLNADGYVTAAELGSFLTDKISNYTLNKQVPRYGKLQDPDYDKGDFVFIMGEDKETPEKTQQAAGISSSANAETLFWTSVKDSSDRKDFEAYLQQYPKGHFRSLANNKLQALSEDVSPSLSRPKPPPVASIISEAQPSATHRNDYEPEMIVIPAGAFMMGSGQGDEDETPIHRVTVPAFEIGKYEITQEEWRKIMGDNPAYFFDCDKCPVEMVSWEDIQEYIRRLNEFSGQYYRLPTEAEWEYAARAGTTSQYSWGDKIDRENANYGKETCCGGLVKGKDQWEYTSPVGSFAPNPWGLFDVHGNVREWVQDCWNESYIGAPTDGSAWLKGDCARRVLRGGSWFFQPESLRSADRQRYYTVNRYNYIGFRLARSL